MFLVKVDTFVLAQLHIQNLSLHFARILKPFRHTSDPIFPIRLFIKWVFCDVKVSVKEFNKKDILGYIWKEIVNINTHTESISCNSIETNDRG